MNEKGVNENCIEQIYRLYKDFLCCGSDPKVDQNGLIRIDNFELQDDVQKIVTERWDNLTQENLNQVADLEGYHQEFLKLFGFSFDNVDYTADVEPNQNLLS